ncbi:MAG: YggS family pyridoxal phosphate-dependent enzyme [Jatrophihabitans sp.]|nr:MAG: YggS family pyridoxal phosphate-dependent enzyme [Jatrophihabitans sp.]
MAAPPDEVRRAHLVSALAALRGRIARACEQCGRDPQAVTLIAVTKTYPASDVVALASLGVADVGENRDQEASRKAADVAAAGVQVRWHLVGRLQTNKARSVASYAAAVHSVDRPELVEALARAAERAARSAPLDVFVQVSLDADPARGGALPALVPALADAVARSGALRLRGVMAVAPLDADPDRAFADLARTARQVREAHPGATAISAGMSGDLDAALRHGATHVRVGTALLGRRDPTFG